MAIAVEKASERRREAPDVRRKQLIEATVKCIARRGISGMTLADVAREAGLSQGIVNLHFKSKENLLNATLAYLADDYAATMERSIAQAGAAARDRLAAIIDMDFNPANYNRRKIAVWYAFRGEAKSRPIYRRICQTRDREYDERLLQVVADLLRETGRDGDSARVVADALGAMTDGLWLSYLMAPREWSRERARKTVFDYLSRVFPDTFCG